MICWNIKFDILIFHFTMKLVLYFLFEKDVVDLFLLLFEYYQRVKCIQTMAGTGRFYSFSKGRKINSIISINSVLLSLSFMNKPEWKEATTKLLGSWSAVPRQLLGSCSAVAWQLLGSCSAVARQLLGSCLAIARQLLGSCLAVAR